MDNDDKPIGRILNRREALAALGLGGLAGAAGLVVGQGGAAQAQNNALPSCIVRPAMAEGPYFELMQPAHDVRINRRVRPCCKDKPNVLENC